MKLVISTSGLTTLCVVLYMYTQRTINNSTHLFSLYSIVGSKYLFLGSYLKSFCQKSSLERYWRASLFLTVVGLIIWFVKADPLLFSLSLSLWTVSIDGILVYIFIKTGCAEMLFWLVKKIKRSFITPN